MQGPLSLKSRMLSTPLINISKASTPIRTRVISNNPPLNSTPINQLKYIVSPSGNNKQNMNSLNETNLLESRKQSQKNLENQRFVGFSKTINFGDQRIKANSPQIKFTPFARQNNKGLNLSPIMALNRKISEGPVKIQGFRSFTPGYIKRAESPLQISRQKLNDSLFKSNSMIFEQKQRGALISASNSNSNLRKSNSFANLFDKTNNNSIRLGSMAFSSISNKNKNTFESQKMKQSLTFNQDNKFISQILCQNDNKKIVKQSPLNTNFQQFSQYQSMCFNNHNKPAKYRVINSQCDGEEQLGQYVYCSKCAIDLVQKGFSRNSNYQPQMISQHTSPRQKGYIMTKNKNIMGQNGEKGNFMGQKYVNVRQSNSFQTKFLQFKPSTTNNMENIQKMKTGQRLKKKLNNQLFCIQRIKSSMNIKFMGQTQQIDCYYNSMISYIQQQRAKDKQILQSLKKQVSSKLLNNHQKYTFEQYENRTCKNIQKVDNLLKTRNFNLMTARQLQQIQSELNQQPQRNQHFDQQTMALLSDQKKRIFYFNSTIQEQFDQFVSYLDTIGKLKFITFKDIGKISQHNQRNGYINQNNYQHQNKPILCKNNALRFSFQKALQNQSRRKMFLQSQMNPLQQQSQEQNEQNSFNQENNMLSNSEENDLTQMQLQDPKQQAFRTLFAEQDQIIQESEHEQNGKNTIYSPNFKSI